MPADEKRKPKGGDDVYPGANPNQGVTGGAEGRGEGAPEPSREAVAPKSRQGEVDWACCLLDRMQTYGAGEVWGFDSTSDASRWASHCSDHLRAIDAHTAALRERVAELEAQLVAARVWREDVEAILDNEGPDGQPHDLTDRVSFCATEAKRAQARERKLREVATWAIYEGHTLGRIYAERLEQEKPAEVWRDLRDRLEAKIAALTEGRAADAE